MGRGVGGAATGAWVGRSDTMEHVPLAQKHAALALHGFEDKLEHASGVGEGDALGVGTGVDTGARVGRELQNAFLPLPCQTHAESLSHSPLDAKLEHGPVQGVGALVGLGVVAGGLLCCTHAAFLPLPTHAHAAPARHCRLPEKDEHAGAAEGGCPEGGIVCAIEEHDPVL